jgi:hypothetical protein
MIFHSKRTGFDVISLRIPETLAIDLADRVGLYARVALLIQQNDVLMPDQQ